MSTKSKKRRAAAIDSDLEESPGKRAKLERANPPSAPSATPADRSSLSITLRGKSLTGHGVQKRTPKSQKSSEHDPKRVKINKLVAPRPFPAVAASASATGPRSAHKEGKNYICLTRKTPLAAYMRRCKSLVIDDGYRTLHLHAAGAAIPLLMQLFCALPPILPYSPDEIHTEVTTGTVEVQDELIPEDEDEDITYRSRGKSTLYVIIRIGDDQSEKEGKKDTGTKSLSRTGSSNARSKKATANKKIRVYQEPEQVQEDI